MTTISSFINRLKKIGIKIELIGNYPWIYMDKVNGYEVKQRYLGNHGFTAFWSGKPDKITDIKKIFEQIRAIVNYDKALKNENISDIITYGTLYYPVWEDSDFGDENFATGEIKSIKKEPDPIGNLFVEGDEKYNYYWVHLGLGYYKQIYKDLFCDDED